MILQSLWKVSFIHLSLHPFILLSLLPSLIIPPHILASLLVPLLFILYLCCRWSALSWAATRGHGRVVRLLLQHSADPTRMNSHGQRPADIALAAGFPQVSWVSTTWSLSSSILLSQLCWGSHQKTRKYFKLMSQIMIESSFSYLVKIEWFGCVLLP